MGTYVTLFVPNQPLVYPHVRFFVNSAFFDVCHKPTIFYRKIKVWDLKAALDPRIPQNALCVRTLVVSKTVYLLFLFSFF